MIKLKILPLFLALFMPFFAYFCLVHVFAQTTTKGVSVTPSIAHIDLSEDPPEYTLTYTNNYPTDITLKLSAKDFTELEDSYRLDFLTQPQAENYKYSLSSWITFENANLQLNPHETKLVKVFIDKDRITKGGHYASILAEIEQAPTQKNIGVKTVLSSLLFVRASTGKEIEDGKISTFEPTRDGIDFPSSFQLRFQNNGNVYVVPYGLVQVYDPFGRLVEHGILNEDSLDALPESIRTYKIPVTTNSFLIPGFYTAKLSIHFGKTNQKLNTQTKFFSQGSFNLLKIAGITIILVALIYVLRKKIVKKKPIP